MMEFNSGIDGLKCVKGHFEHFLPSPRTSILPRLFIDGDRGVLVLDGGAQVEVESKA